MRIIQSILQATAYISTLIASLRAASRLTYLYQNEQLGQMTGYCPLITNNTNNNYTLFGSISLYEWSVGFREAVRAGCCCLLSLGDEQQPQPHHDDDDVSNTTTTNTNTTIDNVTETVTFTFSTTTTTTTDNDDNNNAHYNLFSKRRQRNKLEMEVTAYAPHLFSKLRSQLFGIDEEQFLKTLTTQPFVSFQSNSKGAARVGGLFFFSRDGTYMIKTIKKAEYKTLSKMLPSYYHHMTQFSNTSLLTRFSGLYKVKMREYSVTNNTYLLGATNNVVREEEHVFVILNGVFPPEASSFITERFDLKGSTVGRECSAEEKLSKGTHAVLKDLDLLTPGSEVSSSSTGFHFGSKVKKSLMAQLQEDVKFLVNSGVMDYSLLVGVANTDHIHSSNTSSSGQKGPGCERAARTIDSAPLLSSSMLSATSVPEPKGKKFLMSGSSASSASHDWVPSLDIIHNLLQSSSAFAKKRISTLATGGPGLFPYYGAGSCGVSGGQLSVIPGLRCGKKSVYYLGLIDFLQPWTTRKVLEHEFKGLIGQDKHAISCVSPEEYGTRFLDFIEANIT